MRFASLGSGSEGNAWLIQPDADARSDSPCLMVDCGFTIKAAVERLAKRGLEPAQVAAIVVTHEHADHIGGAFKFSRKFDTPVYLTHGTWRAALQSKRASEEYLETGLVRLFDSHSEFECAGLRVEPFPVPHDAREPIQLLVHTQSATLGLLTDCGSSTPHLIAKLSKADFLVLESNHCPVRLRQSDYPDSLKRRVGGNYGHLSNEVAVEILQKIAGPQLRYVVAAHLSKNTNCPDQVHDMWSAVLDPIGIPFSIACQEEGLDWWTPARLQAA